LNIFIKINKSFPKWKNLRALEKKFVFDNYPSCEVICCEYEFCLEECLINTKADNGSNGGFSYYTKEKKQYRLLV